MKYLFLFILLSKLSFGSDFTTRCFSKDNLIALSFRIAENHKLSNVKVYFCETEKKYYFQNLDPDPDFYSNNEAFMDFNSYEFQLEPNCVARVILPIEITGPNTRFEGYIEGVCNYLLIGTDLVCNN